jgi:hypothetical protein
VTAEGPSHGEAQAHICIGYVYMRIVCLLGGRQPNRPRKQTYDNHFFFPTRPRRTPRAARDQFSLIICILLISHNSILVFVCAPIF